MARLHDTSQALYQLRASSGELDFGLHLGSRPVEGLDGVPIGEMPYDPSRHTPDMINPVSLQEAAFDMPHVSLVVPYRPIEMNVIVHQDPELRELPDYLRPIIGYKQALANLLMGSLAESKQVGDKTQLFVVGETQGADEFDGPVEVVDGTKKPEAAAQAIAGICTRGLTFVISDFNALPFETARGVTFGQTVAIKANHQLERELPADRGRIKLGGLKEVRTWKPDELETANKSLQEKHAAIVAEIGGHGMSVVEVVCNNESVAGFNLSEVDRQIARSVNLISRR